MAAIVSRHGIRVHARSGDSRRRDARRCVATSPKVIDNDRRALSDEQVFDTVDFVRWGSTIRTCRGARVEQHCCPGSAAARDGRAPGSPSWNAGGDGPAWSRKRQPYEPATDRDDADADQPLTRPAARPRAVRRAALPLQLLVPRRRLAPRAAGRGGRPARARGAGAHRPRRALRRGPLRRGGAGGRPADGVRRRAHPRAGRRRPSRRAPRPTRSARSPSHRGDLDAPDPHGQHLLVLADGPTGYARLARALSLGHLAGEKGAPQFDARPTWPTPVQRAAGGCSPGAARARCRRRWCATARAAAARELQRLIELFGRDRVVVELWDHGDPLDSARNDALAELAAPPRPRAASPPTTCTTPRPPQRRLATARRRGAGPAQPRRARPVAAGRRRRAPAQRRRAGAPLRRAIPGVVELAAEIGRAAAFDLSLVAPEPAAVPVPGRADGRPLTEMQYLRQLVEEGGRRRYGERPAAHEDLSHAGPGVAHDRPRARGHRGPRLRRLLPRGVGHRRVLQPGRHLLPGSGQRGQQRGLLRARHHQGRRGVARPAVRAVPVARARRPARHRPRHRERPPRGGHPVRLRALRPAPHRAGRQRHHLPGPLGGARHGARRSATRPASRTRGASRSTRWGNVAATAQQRPDGTSTTTSPRRCSSWPRDRGRAAPPRHPLRRDGHLRPAGRSRCARSSGGGWTTAACCSGTRTTAPRPGW